MVAAHALYFAVPLVLWLILRSVEPQRVFSRLYLAIVLALVYFTSEMVQGIGLWLIWLALLARPVPRATKIAASLLIGAALAFTHPGIALLSLVFGALGLALSALRRRFPRPLAIAAIAMGVLLTVAYFALAALWPPSNPTIAAQHASAKYDYIDPVWMLGTLGFFPMLGLLWLLLLAPGLESTTARWRLSPRATLVVGALGLWFAINGTNLLTWIFARQTAPYALALALCLALAGPTAWLAAARRPLIVFAAVIVAAALSYTVDLMLFSHVVEARLAPFETDDPTPPRFVEVSPSAPSIDLVPERIYFKWSVGQDYVRDVVVPDYGVGRMTFAFYTFFQSARRVVLFRPLSRRGEWIPFECASVDRALGGARDGIDRRMLQFLGEHYCVNRTAIGRP